MELSCLVTQGSTIQEWHGVKRSAIDGLARAMNGYDTWMAHPADDSRLAEKIFLIGCILSIDAEQLDGDLARKVTILGSVNFAKATSVMEGFEVDLGLHDDASTIQLVGHVGDLALDFGGAFTARGIAEITWRVAEALLETQEPFPSLLQWSKQIGPLSAKFL